MKTIPLESVRQFKRNYDWSIPASIATECPSCGGSAIFVTEDDMPDKNMHRAYICSSTCPGCKERATFVFLASTAKTRVAPIIAEVIVMHPSPKQWHQPTDFTDCVAPSLQRAYESTVQSFNTKNYVATAVCCRRTLEGIFKNLVPDDKKKLPLTKLIEEVTSRTDFAAPLNKLSHAIREGGNLGAHFDEELEPTREMASHMVELVEYLLSYLYVLPRKIDGLHDVLGTGGVKNE